MTIRIADNPQEHRFEIFSDDVLAGICEYQRTQTHMDFTHTEVFPEFKGHGFGTPLVRFALEDMKAREEMIIPYCSFVSGLIAKNPDEYLQLVPTNRRAEFGLSN
jgi:predicted GNAT family acetyltransferase